MGGYTTGTSAAGQLRAARTAIHLAANAIKAEYDFGRAWRAAAELDAICAPVTGTGLRAFLLRRMHDEGTGVPRIEEMAAGLPGAVRRSQIYALIEASRKEGEPMTDPGTEPEPPVVALAVVAGPDGVLIARRRDGIPPWTLPGGELEPGESPAECAARRTLAETGVAIEITGTLGRRVHPRTGRFIVYLAASPAGEARAELRDPGDLAEVRWASPATVDGLMGDLFPPARAYLLARLGS